VFLMFISNNNSIQSWFKEKWKRNINKIKN
jgi:hypothetical protein